MATKKKANTGYKEPKFTKAEMENLLNHWNDGVIKPKKSTKEERKKEFRLNEKRKGVRESRESIPGFTIR